MEIFSKIFFIGTSGLFIALFMLLIEHPKRKLIGLIIFAIVALSILISLPIPIPVASLCPFLILLDLKKLTAKVCLIYIGVFFITAWIWATLILAFLPFYYYPILVFGYVLIAKSAYLIAQKRQVKFEEIT